MQIFVKYFIIYNIILAYYGGKLKIIGQGRRCYIGKTLRNADVMSLKRGGWEDKKIVRHFFLLGHTLEEVLPLFDETRADMIQKEYEKRRKSFAERREESLNTPLP